MAKLGRPTAAIVLTDHEHDTLKRYVRRGKTSQALALRARIILMAARGMTGIAIAEKLAINGGTVSKWRRRFLTFRLEALADAPRSGRPRTVDDEKLEQCVRLTLEELPADATHWSTRSMAEAIGVSNATVSRIWRAFGLKPHRYKTFSLSTDPNFIDKVHDIVGLYMHPPHNALVLAIDEKTQIQALDRRQPLLPLMPGSEARGNNDYLRCGTTDLFAALDVKTGAVIGKCYPRHRAVEFRKFLNHVDKTISADVCSAPRNVGRRNRVIRRRIRAPVCPSGHRRSDVFGRTTSARCTAARPGSQSRGGTSAGGCRPVSFIAICCCSRGGGLRR